MPQTDAVVNVQRAGEHPDVENNDRRNQPRRPSLRWCVRLSDESRSGFSCGWSIGEKRHPLPPSSAADGRMEGGSDDRGFRA